MNYRDYIKQAPRTMSKGMSEKDTVSMLCMGLAGEAGEVVDLLKKVHFHGHALDMSELINELGDIHFYLANLMTHYGITEEQVFNANVAKLAKRYPTGFSIEGSKNRIDTKES